MGKRLKAHLAPVIFLLKTLSAHKHLAYLKRKYCFMPRASIFLLIYPN